MSNSFDNILLLQIFYLSTFLLLYHASSFNEWAKLELGYKVFGYVSSLTVI